MVKAQAKTDIPVLQSQRILGKCCRLDVPLPVEECKPLRSIGIEQRWVRNGVLQVFAHRIENRIHANFPIVDSLRARQRNPAVTLPEPALLADDDGSRETVRPQLERFVPEASLSPEQEGW